MPCCTARIICDHFIITRFPFADDDVSNDGRILLIQNTHDGNLSCPLIIARGSEIMPKAVTGICSQDVINRFQDAVHVDNWGDGGDGVHVAVAVVVGCLFILEHRKGEPWIPQQIVTKPKQ